MNNIVIICGPTAVGKTEYAIAAAERLDGEIVSCDSMQLYKFMDIGSAKPTPEEQAQVRHHLIDAVDPREKFSAAKYQQLARKAIDDILSRGKLPVITGGTGLYINSIIYDMDFSAPPADEEERNDLYRIADENGAEYLHDMLKELDSSAAERIHPNNIKKVIRAIESARRGDNIPEFEKSFVPYEKYSPKIIALIRDRDELYERINVRVDILFEKGLVDEVKGLMDMGLTEADISMKGIGYKEVISFLNGEYDIDTAKDLVKKNTRRYAKRQITWLKRYEDCTFFNLSSYSAKEDALEDILTCLKNR